MWIEGIIGGDGRIIWKIGIRKRVEKSLDVRQVDENTARRSVFVYHGTSTRDAIPCSVVNGDLFTVGVEEGDAFQPDRTTKLWVIGVEDALWIGSLYFVDRDIFPILNFDAS